MSAKAAHCTEQMDVGLVWTSPLLGQGSNGWTETTHNMTRRSNKYCPKTQSDNAAKSMELNGVAKTHKYKTRHRFQAHSVELEKSVYKNRRGYSFSTRDYLCTLKALFWARLVPWAEVWQTEWLNSTTQTWRMFLRPRSQDDAREWINSVCRGRPLLLRS